MFDNKLNNFIYSGLPRSLLSLQVAAVCLGHMAAENSAMELFKDSRKTAKRPSSLVYKFPCMLL